MRWERNGDRLLLRTFSSSAYAADSLPIANSVAANNVGAILAAFPVQTYGRDSSVVVDVTEFFAGDTPALSGLDANLRRQYGVRRFDPARSYVNHVRSYPINVEVRHTQTFDAATPPNDASAATVSVEMRQSLVLLPAEPMRPPSPTRGSLLTGRASNTALTCKAARALRPPLATRPAPRPTRRRALAVNRRLLHRPATRRAGARSAQGVEDWQKVFDKAGFRNAVVARTSLREEDRMGSGGPALLGVRWVAERCATPSGRARRPRTGEIIERETDGPQHMRSTAIASSETGASNPARARRH